MRIHKTGVCFPPLPSPAANEKITTERQLKPIFVVQAQPLKGRDYQGLRSAWCQPACQTGRDNHV